MSEAKLVKVDNWGIFFLQRLKHFFNRTDYCDLTLQFQDNAQLKVHRLVLSACTEYFELLERTCEMYEDCLVMPDDLQADVVVPIINFMYTGQLEFRMDLLERLYQTSLVMNMPVLTKLLDAHRTQKILREAYPNPKHYTKSYEKQSSASSSNATSSKRSYSKAFHNDVSSRKYPKHVADKSGFDVNSDVGSNTYEYHMPTLKKHIVSDPRPTRYELPEELEGDNLFDNSFTNISYTSKPLMVHPETTKRYPPKRTGIFEDPSTSKRFIHGRSTMDIVECKKISVNDRIFDDDPSETMCDDQGTYPQPMMSIKNEPRDSNQLFDQILDGGPKVTIETKDNKQAHNLDHAKIISEVLKKYPHLVKSNKNIKLKILNTPGKKKSRPVNHVEDEKEVKQKTKTLSTQDYAYESKVLDSKEAAKLIALGAENISGPWICLICGAPGKAIHFSSYYKFRRHLVDVHDEKPVLNICEYCGQKSMKRNYLLHHLYTKHGVEPPPHYNFPKCNMCNYVALTEGYLIKHKLTHPEKQNYRCNVCSASFTTSNQLLVHIQKTGHKFCADKKTNLQCIYCFKTFTREGNLYAHLRTSHKESARNDGIIDISDDEKPEIKESKFFVKTPPKQDVKYEVPLTYENEYEFDADLQYQIQQQPDGNIQVVSKKPRVLLPTVKHKILNPGFGIATNKIIQKPSLVNSNSSKLSDTTQNTNINIHNSVEELVIIDNNEYVVKHNRLIPKREKSMGCEDYPMSNMLQTHIDESVHNVMPTSTVEFTGEQTTSTEHQKLIANKSGNINQPIQIVVSNEEEYKALMASNHSIIFDDGDTNKTLTVLTAPHDNTTIDLDNTQSNEMMIIPEGYPLNVSEAVTGNNSNIVVVYSHPVDDQNKEYQLIASENLEAQFVTSTAILTQNYETVTTSAPIMNAHELHEAVVEHTWSNTIPENITSNTQLEVPISTNQVTITPTENQRGSITNLEVAQLPTINPETVEILPNADLNQNQPNINTNSINVTETVVNIQPDIIDSNGTEYMETVSSSPTSNMDVDSKNETSDQHIANDVPEVMPQSNIHLEDMSVAQEVDAAEASQQQNLGDTKFMENVSPEGSEESETIENIAKAVNSETVKTDEHGTINNESNDIEEVTLVEAKEQIQNLTSEWSDDEVETSTQERSTSKENNNLKQVTECEAIDTDSQSELEESIENIQQEMEKQLSRPEQQLNTSETVESINEAENSTDTPQQDDIESIEPEKETVVMTETTKTPDKISSLLNDWEDNDSQESEAEVEAPLVCEKEDIELNKEQIDPQDKESTENVKGKLESVEVKKMTSNLEPKAKENIQSLVSDWVEDEEDEETEK